MKQLLSTLSIIIYKALDALKQRSPFWWAIVQCVLWLSFILISTNVLPTFGYKELVLVFLGTLISGVGSRTSAKLNQSSQSKVSAESFKTGLSNATKDISDTKDKLSPKENKVSVRNKLLDREQWIDEKVDKCQIVLHHSVSSSSDSIVKTWNSNKDRVGTAYSIDKDGTINQHFPDDEWAYHLYVNAPGNRIDKKYKSRDLELNKQSIGIELVSMGGLTKRNGNWYTIYKTKVDNSLVYETQYRGYKGFEKYTPEQIESLEKLLIQLVHKYNIPIKKDYTFIFNISNEALNSEPGVYSHVSYRTDKSDCYPDSNLIKMLNSLWEKI